MQSNFNSPYNTSEDMWRKRPHPSRVNDYDSDESSTTGSPWRAMKRLRVAGPMQDECVREPDQELMCAEIQRVVSHTENHHSELSSTCNKDEDYANFNKLLGALHLERKNRELVRTPPVQPNSPSMVQQQQHSQHTRESRMMMTPPDKGRTRRHSTKLKTQSKLA